MLCFSYCIAGKFGGRKFGEFILFRHLAKSIWQINISAKGYYFEVLIWMVLFSLVNQYAGFTKLAKLSRYVVYDNTYLCTIPVN